MMTSSNGNIFRVTGHLCGDSPVPGEFSAQRPVTRGFAVFFDLYLNKWLSKQSWGWWFETPSYPLWRHRNEDWSFSQTPVPLIQNSSGLLDSVTEVTYSKRRPQKHLFKVRIMIMITFKNTNALTITPSICHYNSNTTIMILVAMEIWNIIQQLSYKI